MVKLFYGKGQLYCEVAVNRKNKAVKYLARMPDEAEGVPCVAISPCQNALLIADGSLLVRNRFGMKRYVKIDRPVHSHHLLSSFHNLPFTTADLSSFSRDNKTELSFQEPRCLDKLDYLVRLEDSSIHLLQMFLFYSWDESKVDKVEVWESVDVGNYSLRLLHLINLFTGQESPEEKKPSYVLGLNDQGKLVFLKAEALTPHSLQVTNYRLVSLALESDYSFRTLGNYWLTKDDGEFVYPMIYGSTRYADVRHLCRLQDCQASYRIQVRDHPGLVLFVVSGMVDVKQIKQLLDTADNGTLTYRRRDLVLLENGCLFLTENGRKPCEGEPVAREIVTLLTTKFFLDRNEDLVFLNGNRHTVFPGPFRAAYLPTPLMKPSV